MPATAKGTLGALGTVVAALIGVATTLGWVQWSPLQTALVTAEAAAAVGLVSSLAAHFWPQTQQEPVAVAASITALAAATLGLGVGFGWWTYSPEQINAVVSLVSAALGLGSALVARQLVTARTTRAYRRRTGPTG